MARFSLFGNEADAGNGAQTKADAQPKAPAHPLDAATGGVFSAATSGERAARLRAWLATDPDSASMQEVYKDLSARDKGAARALREKLDELRRSKGQEQLAADWAEKARKLLAASRLHIADAMAWQRDAAKAGAPLSREPLSALKHELSERIRSIEDLQTRVQVQREAAVLLAQRIEVLSTKSWREADAAHDALQADVAQWRAQAHDLQQDAHWNSVDAKYASQLGASTEQLALVAQAFDDALAHTRAAAQDAALALPPVPVWADELRAMRGLPAAAAPQAPQQAPHAEKSPVQHARREEARSAVQAGVDALQQALSAGHSKTSGAVAQALRNALKEHARHLDAALEAQAHAALASASELEGWQRWRADQLRQELVQKARALIVRPQEAAQPAETAPEAAAQTPQSASVPEAAPEEATSEAIPEAASEAKPEAAPEATPETPAEAAPALPVSPHSPRKLQEMLRQLREQWKLTDQGGIPNHALWKQFDAACNDAYRIVQHWLSTMRQQAGAHKAARQALLEELRTWGEDLALQASESAADWKAAHQQANAFSRRWREAGHLSEKAFVELQTQWKAALHAATAPLQSAQKTSVALRQHLIEQARALADGATAFSIDAVRDLQQRWQAEAHAMPLDRKQEQKLWEAFRAPIDALFANRQQQRQQASEALSDRDRQVVQAAQALEEANQSGNAQAIEAALAALEAALHQQRADAADAPPDAPAARHAATPAKKKTAASQDEPPPQRPPAPSATAHRPAIAVRGDDRPGAAAARKADAARREDRRGPAGAARRNDRASTARLGDAAFRAQREAMHNAQAALRKIAAQAQGEIVSRVVEAWSARDAQALPAAGDLGRALSGSQRNAWLAALAAAPQSADCAAQALLRLEIAAEVPTPADHLDERRALQLQLLTRRNDPSPRETWAADVAQLLHAPHDEAQARRLQHALRVLLRL